MTLAQRRAGDTLRIRPARRLAAMVCILIVGIMAGTGCGRGYKETVIPAKEFTPLERARQMLERYAEGQPVGSEFMGFELLKEELTKSSPERAVALGEAFTEIEKVMRRPADVKAIARKALAELDKPVAAQE